MIEKFFEHVVIIVVFSAATGMIFGLIYGTLYLFKLMSPFIVVPLLIIVLAGLMTIADAIEDKFF